jgi:hypothetical protein
MNWTAKLALKRQARGGDLLPIHNAPIPEDSRCQQQQ